RRHSALNRQHRHTPFYWHTSVFGKYSLAAFEYPNQEFLRRSLFQQQRLQSQRRQQQHPLLQLPRIIQSRWRWLWWGWRPRRWRRRSAPMNSISTLNPTTMKISHKVPVEVDKNRVQRNRAPLLVAIAFAFCSFAHAAKTENTLGKKFGTPEEAVASLK